MLNIFDIETGPLPLAEIMEVAPPFSPDEVKVGNRKDKAVIADYIEEKRASYLTDLVESAALEPMYGRILAIGVITSEGETAIFDDDNEGMLLAKFFDLFVRQQMKHPMWTGWNIFHFDLPFIWKRSMKLGISRKPGEFLFDGRWNRNFIDLKVAWCNGERHTYTPLDTPAKWLGIGTKSGSGKDFAALFASDRETALNYLRNDLALTAGIAEKMGLMV